MGSSKEKPIWITFALISTLILPTVFLVGLAVGVNIDSSFKLTADSMSSWVAAFATAAIAILTLILARETWYLRIAQINQIDQIRISAIKPNLEFFLLSAPAGFQFMNVHIENNGSGAAKDIVFEFSGENGDALTEYEKLIVEKFWSLNILRNGIANLGAGKDRKSFIFSFLDFSEIDKKEVFDIKINVKMKYRDIENHEYTSESVLDFSEFKGITEIGGGDPIYNLYKETEKMRKVFEGFQSKISSKRLNINIYSSQDREDEKIAFRRQVKKQKNSDD